MLMMMLSIVDHVGHWDSDLRQPEMTYQLNYKMLCLA
jgi:hypothetical protein